MTISSSGATAVDSNSARPRHLVMDFDDLCRVQPHRIIPIIDAQKSLAHFRDYLLYARVMVHLDTKLVVLSNEFVSHKLKSIIVDAVDADIDHLCWYQLTFLNAANGAKCRNFFVCRRAIDGMNFN